MSDHLFYSGIIRHRRFEPERHVFDYKLFMVCIDLDRVAGLLNVWPLASDSRASLGWFRRKDYIGNPRVPIKDHVLNQVEEQLGFRPQGRVTLLTHLRMWGVLMNPIAVFNCYGKRGELQAVVLQVTNTPWGEQCLYVLKADPDRYKQQFVFKKSMHVSPFHPRDMSYSCRYMLHGNKMVFHLENLQQDKRITDATLVMQAQPLNHKKLLQAVLLYPYMTSKVFYGIYKQALHLFIKKTPVYTNPLTPRLKNEKLSRGQLAK